MKRPDRVLGAADGARGPLRPRPPGDVGRGRLPFATGPRLQEALPVEGGFEIPQAEVGFNFFTCRIPLTEITKKPMPLFPGKVNRWIVQTSTPAQNAADVGNKIEATVSFLLSSHPNHSQIHNTLVRDLVISPQLAVGPPKDLFSMLDIVSRPDVLSPARLFVGVEFVYVGKATHTPWRWDKSPGLADCAEDGYGVAAVLSPRDLTPKELEQAKDSGIIPPIFGEIGEQAAAAISSATKFLLFGGSAVLLFSLYNATKGKVAK